MNKRINYRLSNAHLPSRWKVGFLLKGSTPLQNRPRVEGNPLRQNKFPESTLLQRGSSRAAQSITSLRSTGACDVVIEPHIH